MEVELADPVDPVLRTLLDVQHERLQVGREVRHTRHLRASRRHFHADPSQHSAADRPPSACRTDALPDNPCRYGDLTSDALVAKGNKGVEEAKEGGVRAAPRVAVPRPGPGWRGRAAAPGNARGRHPWWGAALGRCC
ncbi:hypothetical protein GCM10009554_55870 [Kribbella koreensis]|uniref:Uncharacterized protein n=1 Tax=Kribbella koreensis TaxID=57909 RepID=A0ABP4BNL4_9ACTN